MKVFYWARNAADESVKPVTNVREMDHVKLPQHAKLLKQMRYSDALTNVLLVRLFLRLQYTAVHSPIADIEAKQQAVEVAASRGTVGDERVQRVEGALCRPPTRSMHCRPTRRRHPAHPRHVRPQSSTIYGYYAHSCHHH